MALSQRHNTKSTAATTATPSCSSVSPTKKKHGGARSPNHCQAEMPIRIESCTEIQAHRTIRNPKNKMVDVVEHFSTNVKDMASGKYVVFDSHNKEAPHTPLYKLLLKFRDVQHVVRIRICGNNFKNSRFVVALDVDGATMIGTSRCCPKDDDGKRYTIMITCNRPGGTGAVLTNSLYIWELDECTHFRHRHSLSVMGHSQGHCDSQGSASSLVASIVDRLFDNRSLADVALMVGNKCVYANKAILAAWCDYFTAKFYDMAHVTHSTTSRFPDARAPSPLNIVTVDLTADVIDVPLVVVEEEVEVEAATTPGEHGGDDGVTRGAIKPYVPTADEIAVGFKAIKAMVRFMYTGTLYFDPPPQTNGERDELLLKVLHLSRVMGIDKLMEVVVERLYHAMSVSNIVSFTSFAKGHDLKRLEERCMKYLLDNAGALTNMTTAMEELRRHGMTDYVLQGLANRQQQQQQQQHKGSSVQSSMVPGLGSTERPHKRHRV